MHVIQKVPLQAADSGTEPFPNVHPDRQGSVQLQHTDGVAYSASHHTLPNTRSDTDAHKIAHTSNDSSPYKFPDIHPNQCFRIRLEGTDCFANTVSYSGTYARPDNSAHCAGHLRAD